jgi:hypothetical protein
MRVGLGPVVALAPGGEADAEAAQREGEERPHDGQRDEQLEEREATPPH